MNGIFDLEKLIAVLPKDVYVLRKQISGTYKNSPTPLDPTIVELRVDVDGRRSQNRISGDVFREYKKIFGWPLVPPLVLYEYSFVVEDIKQKTEDDGVVVLKGPIVYYREPTSILGKYSVDTLEVRIEPVPFYAKPADAIITFNHLGHTKKYCAPKISDYFRTVVLEIDRFQGTTFPPTVNTHVDPHPADLPNEDLSVREIYRRAGIDMRVEEDDVLNDPDSTDIGTNWNVAELHDLMEDRFDEFANTLQWITYGVVVPRFGDPHYDPDYYGVMFDWGGWQFGDSYFRQGAAIAHDAIQGRTVGNLYNSAAKKDRLTLFTFVHEVGHSFNLPHTWQRTDNPDSASNSFMNYPMLYTGGGGESGFWSDFRWEFDDVELIWMRHADRNYVIFGGEDWIGDNLIRYLEPQAELGEPNLSLELRARPLLEFAEPVRIEIVLENTSTFPVRVVDRLEPEDGNVTLFIKRPSGEYVRYVPPVHRERTPGESVELDPGESIQESVLLSYGAKGLQFQEPGEYLIRAYYGWEGETGLMSRALRLRVAAPTSRDEEELGVVLFDPKVAKFLYFSGTARYPEALSQLEEVTRKYEETHPRVVRHVKAAIGLYQSRDFKRVVVKKGARVVTHRKANLEEAIRDLEAAVALLPEREESAVDDARYAWLSGRLAQCQLEDGRATEADKTRKAATKYLERRGASKRLI